VKHQHERTELIGFWIREREEIKMKKNYGLPQPWSTDPILSTYRFCNVRREDDRVTQWLRFNWRTPFHDHPNLTLAMAMARFVNWPPTLTELGFPKKWEPEKFIKILQARKARKEQVWNGAYMISTCGAKSDKAEHVAGVLNRVHVGPAKPLGGDTLEMAHGRLKKIFGLGNFLAAQIVADLKNTPFNPLQKAADWWTWAAPGPGSERGLRWWLDRTQAVAPYEFLPRLGDLIANVTPLIQGIAPLSAQDWQNVCCEVSKYVKAKFHDGRPKQKYESREEAFRV
jgi:hypothetical protein